jgi:hypothetical protein
MTDFTFNDTIPAAANNPSNDQPIMLANNVSNQGIWDVDHIGFNALNGGSHQFMTMFADPNYIIPAASTANGSVIYTNAGTASTNAQCFFQNSIATVPMSSIRAFGSFVATAVGVNPILLTEYNIASATHPGSYLITLTANAVSGNGVMILVVGTVVPGSLAGVQSYSFTNPVLTIAANGTSGYIINFLVVQI